MATNLEVAVRMKKRDGRAEFSSKGIRWTPDSTPIDGESVKPIVVPWSTVQDQQVSSLTSPKAMIRLRLTSNATLVLDFISEKSLEDAFEAREKAKMFITQQLQLLAQTQGARSSGQSTRAPLCTPAEIKQRAALLAANPTLKRQHTEMVNEGLISEEDFWASRRHLLANEASKRQKTAKTSAILTDLTGDNDTGGNVVKYNLNAEVIHQIFVQYPAVHLAYQAQVPEKMTETEFWSAFFKSKYFHRDRKAGHEDLFSKYEEKEKELTTAVAVDPRGIVDPLVDLTATEQDGSTALSKEITGTNKNSTKEDPLGLTIAKFNRHGAYVLDPVHAGKLTTHPKEAAAALKKTRPTFHDNLKEATVLDDLQKKESPPYNPLTLEDESRYFHHATQDTDSAGYGTETSSTALADAAAHFRSVCRSSFPLAKAFPTAKTSFDVLSEIVACSDSGQDAASLSSSAALASGAQAAEYIPTEFKKQVYNQFHDVCELLRHFLAFKAKVARGGDADTKHKLNKIVEKMGSKYDELVKIREALPPHEKNLLAPLLKPFDDQLNLAFI